MNQASFFCPHCQQQRLFQSTPMNHTPHILAAVFLCGLWLPIWILMAVTHQDVWRCVFCGHSDAVKYLANPSLRQDEQIAADYRRREDQKRREENERRLAAMPRETTYDNLAYIWAAHKIPILAFGGAVLFIGFLFVPSVINRSSAPNVANQSEPGNASPAVPKLTSEIKRIFDAAILAGKGPREVEKILGSPTDSWTPRTGSNNLMQSYALGEDMTVEFRNNSIDSFVIFFNQKNVDSETAHRLVGLNPSQPKPKGISNINTGENWIKVFYSNTVTNSSDTAPISNSKPTAAPSSSSRIAQIISENANFRSTADSYGEILNVVPYGEEVEIVKQKGPWFQVKYLGQSGWVHGNTIRLLY